MLDKDPQILIGLRVDTYPPNYYLGFPCTNHDGAYYNVRAMLEARLAELECRARALRAVLATADPEAAESTLCDGSRMQIKEVVLRPPSSREAIAAFVERSFAIRTQAHEG